MSSAADVLSSRSVLVHSVILAQWQNFVSAEASVSSFLHLSEILRLHLHQHCPVKNITCNQLPVPLKQLTFESDGPRNFSPTPSTIQPTSPQFVFQDTMGNCQR